MSARSLREATFAFIDVETTGIDRRNDRVVEIACLIVRGSQTCATLSSFVDPQRPIPATASAIHHITDADVAGAPTLAQLAPHLRELCEGAVIVAHNARFDLGFLPFLFGHDVICSMRLAMHVIPEAPNFKNQVLRYHLGIHDARLAGSSAHRALGDAIVTQHVFGICLERYLLANQPDDIDALVAALAAPRHLAASRRGGSRDRSIGPLPDRYLRRLAAAPDTTEHVRSTALRELARRESSVA